LDESAFVTLSSQSVGILHVWTGRNRFKF